MKYNKLKIGEFSRLSRVTVRTLRHYAEMGLLVPDIIDRETGYRYYSVGQFQKMQNILQLKELGFSLDEIRELWEGECHFPGISALEEKIRNCEAELERLKKRHRALKAVVASRKKIEKMETIYFETLPEIIVACHRATIPSYNELGRLCYEVIGPEMARLGCECPEPGYCYSIEHGGYRPNDVDIEYCEQVRSMGKDSDIIKFKRVPAAPKAVCMKVYGSYDKLPQAYRDLLTWIDEQGYRITASPRASYVDGIWNREDFDQWLTIIQVPVEG